MAPRPKTKRNPSGFTSNVPPKKRLGQFGKFIQEGVRTKTPKFKPVGIKKTVRRG